ncbi:MAG TPA: hypothetical protein VD858_07005, partial [Reyranella sp.]|nr:hypothetical protein [Reyranella sp.]
IQQVRDRRSLVAADVGHPGLKQRLRHRHDPFAVEGLAVAQLERLDFVVKGNLQDLSPMRTEPGRREKTRPASRPLAAGCFGLL